MAPCFVQFIDEVPDGRRHLCQLRYIVHNFTETSHSFIKRYSSISWTIGFIREFTVCCDPGKDDSHHTIGLDITLILSHNQG